MKRSHKNIAKLLYKNRTWTNWPQMNDVSIGITDNLDLSEVDKEVFLDLCGAKQCGHLNHGPYKDGDIE